MHKRETLLDWQILEEGAARPHPSSTQAHQKKSRRRPRRSKRAALVLLAAILLPLGVEGYRILRRAGQEMTRVENEVRAAVAADAWIDQNQGDSFNTVGLAHPILEIAQTSGLEARRVEVHGDYAMVEVWANHSDQPWLPAPYRQTRFYQETAQGWLAVDPPDVFYQPLDTLQVGRFTFVYGSRDADAVLEASRQVKAVDAELRAELGLLDTDETLTIKVITSFLPSLDPVELMLLSEGATLYTPSPALLALPAPLSEGDALVQLVAGLLIKRDLDEALGGFLSGCEQQQPLASGLRLWLLHEYSELPSTFHYYDETLVHYRLEHERLPPLTWLEPGRNIAPSDPLPRYQCYSAAKYDVAAAFVDYAVSAYGRDKVPALLDAMRRYATLGELIPAVYGVSPAAFEQGWQAYLVQE